MNVKKCKYMCFTRLYPTNGFYTMNGAIVDLVNSFNELGTIFNYKLDFRNHIISTASKVKCILDFIKRWAKEFSDPYVIKQLFTNLVIPILEYESVIWNPLYAVHSDKIESVQKQGSNHGCRRYRTKINET